MIIPFGFHGVSVAGGLPGVSGIVAHYDANVGITLNGADVSAWADQTVNGNDLAQGSASDQPLFVSSDAGFNSLPVVEFDGSTEHIEVLDFHVSALSSSTVILCAKFVSTSAAIKVLYSSGNHVANRAYFGHETTPVFNLWNGFGLGGSAADTNVHVFACRVTASTTATMFLDGGTADISGTPGGEVLEGMTLGAWYNGSLDGNVRIAEVTVYDSYLSDADTNLVGNYMATKYNTTWTDI